VATRNSTKVRFTAAFVSQVVRGDITGEFQDTESPLRIRSTRTGAQYRVQKKVAGRVVKITYPSPDAAKHIKLSEARKWARGVFADAARGRLPERRKAGGGATVEVYGADLLKAYAEKATPASVTARKYGLAYINALIGSTPVTEVGREQVLAVRDWDTTPSKRTRAWVAAKWLMARAVESGLVETNPFAAGIKPPARPRPRKRYPALDDLATVEAACLAEGSVAAEIVRLILRQPLRRSAAESLRWREIDLDGRLLRLEGGHGRKAKETVALPLSPAACAYLAARRPAGVDGDALVFPHARALPWAAVIRRLQREAGFSWSPHDLRRSAVSLVAEYRPDVSESHLDRWLGHASAGQRTVAGRAYQHAAGVRGMRRAAAAWSWIVELALDGRADEVRAEADAYAEAA
jgi:integrase